MKLIDTLTISFMFVALVFISLTIIQIQETLQEPKTEIDYAYIEDLAIWINNNSEIRHNSEIKTYNSLRSVCNPSYTLQFPEDRDTIQLALEFVKNVKEYELDEYDCTEKSQLLEKLLKEMGYERADTYIVFIDCETFSLGDGYTYEDCKDNNKHEITCIGGLKGICYEATGGFRIEPQYYKDWGIK